MQKLEKLNVEEIKHPPKAGKSMEGIILKTALQWVELVVD